MGSRLLVSVCKRGLTPLLGVNDSSVLKLFRPVSALNQRHVSSVTKRGTGGRSSFSGIVATVFGATGFIGRYVVNKLGKMGSQVVVPFRGDVHDYRHLRLLGDLGQVVFLEYSLRDSESVRKAVEHSNVVINLVGRDYETRNFKFGEVHVDGARTIAEACRDCDVKRLIHFSALNADQDSPSKFLQSKAFGEEVVRDIFPDVTIVRPADVYGHEDRFLRYYASLRIFPFGMIPLLKGGEGVVKRPVYVGDVASAVLEMITDPSFDTLEFVGPKGYPLPELVRYLYSVMYRDCKIIAPPSSLFKMVAFLLEQNPFIPYMTRDILTRLHLSNSPTPNVPGLEDLGITPTRLEDKAISFLRMYRNFLDFYRPIEETHPSSAQAGK